MPAPATAAIIETCLPLLVMAGDYAREIQPRLAETGGKPGANAWTQAVTDADASVQAFFEVATLACFPGTGFYGEEQAESRNARYFDPGAPVRLWLDPVNGTYLYRNQRPGWDIVLSVTRGSRLEAVVSYMPARGTFYLAVHGHGALTGDRHCTRLAEFAPLRTRPGPGLCVGYQAKELLERARTRFDAFDIVHDDDPARNFDNLDDLFTGRLDAYFARGAEQLDWGAMAYVVVAAGGVATTPAGAPLALFDHFDGGTTDLVVAGTPEAHRELLAAFNASR